MAMAGCNIQRANVVSNWQKNNRKLYIYRISQLAGRYPAAPASRAQNLHGAYQPGDNPQAAARGDRLLFAGAFATTPYFNIGHKKRCASNTPQTSIFNLLRR